MSGIYEPSRISFLDTGTDISYSDPAPDPGYASTPGQEEFAKIVPFYDVYSPFMRCGRDSGSGPNTSTATVLAGSEIGFRLADIWTESDNIFHDGPGQVYLSKAPNGDVEHYDGSGHWFKIAVAGAANDTEWKLYRQNHMLFKIPEKTPPGKYLLRIEHFEPRWALDGSQWYVSCAHVDIVGLGGGEPSHFVKFPGGYDMFDSGEYLF